MITFFSTQHRLHAPTHEIFRGERVPCFESPSRADLVRAEVAARGHEVCTPTCDSREVLAKVHAPRYLTFLESAWETVGGARPCQCRVSAVSVSLADSHTTQRPGTLRLHCAAGPVFDGQRQSAVRGNLDRGQGRCRCGSQRRRAARRRRAQRLLCNAPAWPSRRGRLHGRLLLPQQRCGRRPSPARKRMCARCHPRRRLSPRQWNTGHFLCAVGCAGREPSWRPAYRISVLLGTCRRNRRRRGSGLQPESAHAGSVPLRANGSPHWKSPASALQRHRPDALVVSLGLDTFVDDPISKFGLRVHDFSKTGCPAQAAESANRFHPGRWLRRR